MADLDFFFDPVCPWAWITSRWVSEVQQLRSYDVHWRFISLAVLNDDLVADWYTPEYRRGHVAGLEALRVADAVRVTADNAAVGAFYTTLGTAIHRDQRGAQLREGPFEQLVELFAETLTAAGLDPALAGHAGDESHDVHIRAETALARQRAGNDVGTPILTFHPGAADENSFFGPVIAAAPRGEAAVRLWDAIELIATTSGMAELKRSLRSRPVFD